MYSKVSWSFSHTGMFVYMFISFVALEWLFVKLVGRVSDIVACLIAFLLGLLMAYVPLGIQG